MKILLDSNTKEPEAFYTIWYVLTHPGIYVNIEFASDAVLSFGLGAAYFIRNDTLVPLEFPKGHEWNKSRFITSPKNQSITFVFD